MRLTNEMLRRRANQLGVHTLALILHKAVTPEVHSLTIWNLGHIPFKRVLACTIVSARHNMTGRA